MTKLLNKWSAAVQKSRFASNGYLLPVVIALGLGISTTGMVALQTVAQNSTTLNDQTYAQLAEEAAKAGIAAALSCIRTGDITNIAWTTLTPNSDCKSAINANKPATVHADAVDNITSTYSVAAPTQPTSGTMLLTSTGTVTIRTAAGQVVKTITKTARNLAKVVVTPEVPGIPGPRNYLRFFSVVDGPNNSCGFVDVKDGPRYKLNLWCWGLMNTSQYGYAKRTIITGNCGMVIYNPSPCTSPQRIVYAGSNWPRPTSGAAHYNKLTIGNSHACFIYSINKNVYCWGDESAGQLGPLGAWQNIAGNVANIPIGQVRDVKAYGDLTCAMAQTSARIFCWGGWDSNIRELIIPSDRAYSYGALGHARNDPNAVCASLYSAEPYPRDYCWGSSFGSYSGNPVFVADWTTYPYWFRDVNSYQWLNPVSPSVHHTCRGIGYQPNDDASIPRSGLLCQGYNHWGQLADGTTVSSAFEKESPFIIGYHSNPITPGTPASVTYNGQMNF